jgi:hypothetical protein
MLNFWESAYQTGARLAGWDIQRLTALGSERSSEHFYALAMLAYAVICSGVLQQPVGFRKLGRER